jgi:hypothetical protein
MAIVAPLSKFKKTNIKIYIVFCFGFAVWCAYDGYFNQTWIADHTDAEGNPELYLSVNRTAPFLLVGAAALLGVYAYAIRNRRITAEENELVFSDKLRIPYDCIERVDKTHFDKKGYFVFTYRTNNETEVDKKVGDRTYDNLGAVLDVLVAHLTGQAPSTEAGRQEAGEHG